MGVPPSDATATTSPKSNFGGREAGRISSKLPLCPLSVDNSDSGHSIFSISFRDSSASFASFFMLCFDELSPIVCGLCHKDETVSCSAEVFRWMNFSHLLVRALQLG